MRISLRKRSVFGLFGVYGAVWWPRGADQVWCGMRPSPQPEVYRQGVVVACILRYSVWLDYFVGRRTFFPEFLFLVRTFMLRRVECKCLVLYR